MGGGRDVASQPRREKVGASAPARMQALQVVSRFEGARVWFPGVDSPRRRKIGERSQRQRTPQLGRCHDVDSRRELVVVVVVVAFVCEVGRQKSAAWAPGGSATRGAVIEGGTRATNREE